MGPVSAGAGPAHRGPGAPALFFRFQRGLEAWGCSSGTLCSSPQRGAQPVGFIRSVRISSLLVQPGQCR